MVGLVIAAGLALAIVAVSGADTAPIPVSTDLPWTDPAHQSPLERLLSSIATHIAGSQVSVECEGKSAWQALVTGEGGDPNAESGFVGSQWSGSTGQLLTLSSVAQLSSSICLPLERFATAVPKPTKCLVPGPTRTVLGKGARLGVRAGPARPGPCYLGNGKTAAMMSALWWADYSTYADAILSVAHEAIHLSGIVGGTLSNGLQVGDPEAEAKADCYGMQWMPYVAGQLGDTPDDAQAIATYFWDKIYPLDKVENPVYWSPDCRPGGALDLHLPGTTAWP